MDKQLSWGIQNPDPLQTNHFNSLPTKSSPQPYLSHSLPLSLCHKVHARSLVRPFLEEAVGDGDGVSDAAVDVLGRVAPLPHGAAHAAGAVAAVLSGVDHGLLLLHPAADVADEAVDAAEEHRAEDQHGGHQDLGDGRAGRGGLGRAG